jgi:hypothetical protein
MKKNIRAINIRITAEIKEALDQYCAVHVDKMAVVVTSAIKEFIGFAKNDVNERPEIIKCTGQKEVKLDVRMDERIKVALEMYCDRHGVTITDVVTSAIINHIK